MSFRKMQINQYPARQWALVGYPNAGKSTFAAQMRAPLLTVDADHRFGEVAQLAAGDVYELSDNPADNIDARRIDALLRANMAASGVKTIIVDSLTAILAPIVGRAVLANDAGENTNRIAAFKDKALTMRLLQDAITGYGVDTLWIYHLREGRDNKAKKQIAKSISSVELARLRRSLNMELAIVADGARRGVKVEWARRGRSGMTLWDDTGVWLGMPERVEEAVYGGLSAAEMDSIEASTPKHFASADAAIAWGFEQGCFRDAQHAKNALHKAKAELLAMQPDAKAADMWAAWVADVQRRKNESAA